MPTLVMKFGGSLASDARSITRIAQIILAESLAWPRMVVVVSAMAGVTDTLANAVEIATIRDGAGYRKAVAGIRRLHVQVIEVLFSSTSVQHALIKQMDRWLFTALTVCDAVANRREALPRDRDAVMVIGERIMTDILTALVQHEGLRCALVDSAAVIITDDHFQNANPLLEIVEERVDHILKPLLAESMVVLISGFIGATRNGVMTTLGRGGSDYTATILAAALHADEVWMWTQVEGIMSADPVLVPNARVIANLSYTEIRELSYFGVRVLHPRAVEPLVATKIPLRVRSPLHVELAGTLIQAESTDVTGNGLKAVTAVDGLLLFSTEPGIDLVEFLSHINSLVRQAATGPVMVLQSQRGSMLIFVVPTSEGPSAAAGVVQRLAAGLQPRRWEIRATKVIAVMGTLKNAGVLASIPSLAYAQGPRDRCLFAVAPEDTQATVRQLYALLG